MVDVIQKMLHINGDLLLQRPRIKQIDLVHGFLLKRFKNPSSACLVLHLFHEDKKAYIFTFANTGMFPHLNYRKAKRSILCERFHDIQ